MLGVVAHAHVVFFPQRHEVVVDVEVDRAVHVDDLRLVVQRILVMMASMMVMTVVTVMMAMAMTMTMAVIPSSVVERVDELRAIEHLEDLRSDRAATARDHPVYRSPAICTERGGLRIGPRVAVPGGFVRA
jgi:hypothetical protein